MIKVKKALLGLFLTTSLSSCINVRKAADYAGKHFKASCNDIDYKYTTYQKCEITDIEQLFHVRVDNMDKSDKVILMLDGGVNWEGGGLPDTYQHFGKFDPGNPPPTFDPKDNDSFHSYGITPWEVQLLEVVNDFNVSLYSIRQSQWLKWKTFNEAGDISGLTYEDGYKEFLETVSYIPQVVKHFKDQGKKVGLVGHGYGALLLNQYLAKYGDDDLAYALSAAGRLKIGNTDKIKELFDEMEERNLANLTIKPGDDIDYGLRQIRKIDANPADLNKRETINARVGIKLGLLPLIKDYTKEFSRDNKLEYSIFVNSVDNWGMGSFNSYELAWLSNKEARVEVYDEATTQRFYNQWYKSDLAKPQFARYVTMWSRDEIEKWYITQFNNRIKTCGGTKGAC